MINDTWETNHMCLNHIILGTLRLQSSWGKFLMSFVMSHMTGQILIQYSPNNFTEVGVSGVPKPRWWWYTQRVVQTPAPIRAITCKSNLLCLWWENGAVLSSERRKQHSHPCCLRSNRLIRGRSSSIDERKLAERILKARRRWTFWTWRVLQLPVRWSKWSSMSDICSRLFAGLRVKSIGSRSVKAYGLWGQSAFSPWPFPKIVSRESLKPFPHWKAGYREQSWVYWKSSVTSETNLVTKM